MTVLNFIVAHPSQPIRKFIEKERKKEASVSFLLSGHLLLCFLNILCIQCVFLDIILQKSMKTKWFENKILMCKEAVFTL